MNEDITLHRIYILALWQGYGKQCICKVSQYIYTVFIGRCKPIYQRKRRDGKHGSKVLQEGGGLQFSRARSGRLLGRGVIGGKGVGHGIWGNSIPGSCRENLRRDSQWVRFSFAISVWFLHSFHASAKNIKHQGSQVVSSFLLFLILLTWVDLTFQLQHCILKCKWQTARKQTESRQETDRKQCTSAALQRLL